MVVHTKGLHHFYVRKRIYKKHEKYPSEDKWKKIIDKFIYIIAIIGIVMTLPQIWNIWVGKEAAGVSALSWAAYTFIAVFWFVYGIVHKEKAIIFNYTALIILDALVVIGTLMYG